MSNKDLLLKLGEETIYSAKGHFKSHDVRHRMITLTIWGCAAINVAGVIGLENETSRFLAVAGLLGTMALLIWNQGEGKEYRSRHKQAGERYLSLHKEARDLFFLNQLNIEDIEKLSKKVRKFDQSDKPNISWLARKLSKTAIESAGETDNWFEE